MHPDWLGSPQHVAAGALLTPLVAELVRRLAPRSRALIAIAAIAVTMGAEALVELIEYPLLYQHDVSRTAYLDTVADIASTLAGAILGAVAWLVVRRLLGPRGRAQPGRR